MQPNPKPDAFVITDRTPQFVYLNPVYYGNGDDLFSGIVAVPGVKMSTSNFNAQVQAGEIIVTGDLVAEGNNAD